MTSLTLFATGTSAQTTPCDVAEVDREVAAANDDRRLGRALPAVDRMSALWHRCPSPRVQAQLGLAEQGALRWRDGYLHLRAALATEDAWVAQRRAPLARSLGEIAEHLPRLSPQCNVPGAVLVVDGTEVGRLPLAEPYLLPSGVASLEVRAAGYRPGRRAVSVPENTVFREVFSLEPEGAMRVAEAVGAPRAVAADPPRRGPYRALGVAGLVGGAVLAGVGALGLALRNGAVDTFNDAREDCYVDHGAVRMVDERGGCQAAFDDAQTFQALSVAGFVTGAALAAGGLVLLLLDRGEARPTRSVRVSCGVLLGVTGVTCGGVF